MSKEEKKEKQRQYCREYHQKNQEQIQERKRRYYQENKEEIDRKNQENYWKNKDHYSKIKKEWYQDNREKMLEKRKEYVKNNYRQVRDGWNRWERNKRANDPIYRIRKSISRNINNSLRKGKRLKDSRHWEDIVGYTTEELKEHLESKFKDSMTWENYGEWHIDHIKPLSWFNFERDEDFKKAWAIENLQPLWAEENMIKQNKYKG